MSEQIDQIRHNQDMFLGIMRTMQNVLNEYLSKEQSVMLENAKWEISSRFDSQAIIIINEKFHAY